MKKNYQIPVINLFALSVDDILTTSGLGALKENVNRSVGTNASYGDDIVKWGKVAK